MHRLFNTHKVRVRLRHLASLGGTSFMERLGSLMDSGHIKTKTQKIILARMVLYENAPISITLLCRIALEFGYTLEHFFAPEPATPAQGLGNIFGNHNHTVVQSGTGNIVNIYVRKEPLR